MTQTKRSHFVGITPECLRFFVPFYLKFTSGSSTCQDVNFRNLTSDMIEDNNQHQQEEKSPLRLLRERAELTQFQLRQRIGVSERRLSDWENGKALPSLENAVALARTLQVSLKQLCMALKIDVTGIPDDCQHNQPPKRSQTTE